jgi:hypothetical protein
MKIAIVRANRSGAARTGLPQSLLDLLQVVLGMGTMDATPVFGVQRAQDRMVEYFARASESFLRIR